MSDFTTTKPSSKADAGDTGEVEVVSARPTDTSDPEAWEAGFKDVDAKRLLWKIDLHLIPWLCVIYRSLGFWTLDQCLLSLGLTAGCLLRQPQCSVSWIAWPLAMLGFMGSKRILVLQTCNVSCPSILSLCPAWC